MGKIILKAIWRPGLQLPCRYLLGSSAASGNHFTTCTGPAGETPDWQSSSRETPDWQPSSGETPDWQPSAAPAMLRVTARGLWSLPPSVPPTALFHFTILSLSFWKLLGLRPHWASAVHGMLPLPLRVLLFSDISLVFTGPSPLSRSLRADQAPWETPSAHDRSSPELSLRRPSPLMQHACSYLNSTFKNDHFLVTASWNYSWIIWARICKLVRSLTNFINTTIWSLPLKPLSAFIYSTCFLS